MGVILEVIVALLILGPFEVIIGIWIARCLRKRKRDKNDKQNGQ